MRIASYILAAKQLLEKYDGKVPFAAWVKEYFREHKKFGSRDRKTVSHLCYCFFRLGNSFQALPIEERIAIGLFLTSQQSNSMLGELNGEWNQDASKSSAQKLELLQATDQQLHIFPLIDKLSSEIEVDAFVATHFLQPDLFLRVRPGKQKVVQQSLTDAGLPFESHAPAALALPNATKIEEVLRVDEDAVVQDLSSQQVLTPLQEVFDTKQNFTAWDCCAASGGKSILLYDTFPKVDLTVSDIRSSILRNLHNRFSRAGIKHYQSFVADISAPQYVPARKYDLVICDAPCSGSGTWGRTPEQLSSFTSDKLEYYSNLQKWIVVNASKAVNQQGALLYITCSVYKSENEDVVTHLIKNTSLKLRSMQYYKGYSKRADTLFVALFTL